MDNNLGFEEESWLEDAAIEDALSSYPLAPMPRSVTARVMTRLDGETRPELITRKDLGLGLVISICVASLFFAWQNLPPIMAAKLRIDWILLYQVFLVNARWLVPTMMLSVTLVLFALALPFLQPKQTY